MSNQISKYKRTSSILKKDQLTLKELDKALDDLNIQAVLKSQIRQVKWLYNNSNKYCLVYEEKLVRAIVQRLEDKIKTLQEVIESERS